MLVLTPANQNVRPEVLPLREERHCQKSMEIKAFDQEPEETGHYAVLEEDHHGFAAHLGEWI